MGKEKDSLCDIVKKSEIPQQIFLNQMNVLYVCLKDKMPVPINLVEKYCKSNHCPSLKDYHPNNNSEDVDSV
jgi:hypothetical protein